MYFSVFRYRNQTVAIKIIKRGESPEEIAKKDSRFAREIAMLSKVQHKNLVKVSPFFHSLFILANTEYPMITFEKSVLYSSLERAKNQ